MVLCTELGGEVMFVACVVYIAIEVICVLSTLVLLRRILNSTLLVVPKQFMMKIHLWKVRVLVKVCAMFKGC